MLSLEDPCLEPAGASPRDATLLTGATGFLGRHLLLELLRTGDRPIICLVRAADDAAARQRIERALAEAGPAAAGIAWGDRVQVLAAHLDRPGFGLPEAVRIRLAAQIDTVLHAAAEVNWVKSYRQLRASNVVATAEIVRFCLAARVRRLQFVSTLAVCFSRLAPQHVPEQADPLDWVSGMPLAYARTKAVAERLLRRAAARGLVTGIIRPGLLCGDTLSGANSPGDIVSALLATCVRLQRAPDVDWAFDGLPVDFAARAIVALGARQRTALTIHHLRHDRPRHWRELVLWLNLSGHPVRFQPLDAWLDAVFGGSGAGHGDSRLPLSSFRRLFRQTPAESGSDGYDGQDGHERPFEVYLSAAQQAVASDCTARLLARLDLPAPALDGPLLRRYFRHLERTRVLPYVPGRSGQSSGVETGSASSREDPVPASLKQQVARALTGDAMANLVWVEQPFDARDGLLAEMASARTTASIGLHRYRLQVRTQACAGMRRADWPDTVPPAAADIVIKLKPLDLRVIGAVVEAVDLLDPVQAAALAPHAVALGLSQSHRREADIQRRLPRPLRRYLPRCLGTIAPGEPQGSSTHGAAAEGIWGLAIEYLPEGTSRWTAHGGWGWCRADRQAALATMVDLHVGWVDNEPGAAAVDFFRDPVTADSAVRLQPAWQALANVSAPVFSDVAGREIADLHRRWIATIADWWQELASLPRTVIHNDFNPRNLVLRRRDGRGGASSGIVVLDWELAQAGPPQQDLAELLCFVWPDAEGEDAFWADVDVCRRGINAGTGLAIGRESWRRGLELAMRRLLLQRLPLYAIADRFQRQPFLPALLRNWQRIHRWVSPGELASRSIGSRIARS